MSCQKVKIAFAKNPDVSACRWTDNMTPYSKLQYATSASTSMGVNEPLCSSSPSISQLNEALLSSANYLPNTSGNVPKNDVDIYIYIDWLLI